MAVVPQDAAEGEEAERQSFSRYCLQVEIVIVSNGGEGGGSRLLQQEEGDEEDGYEENGAAVLLQEYRNDGCRQQHQRNFSPGDSFGFRILMLKANPNSTFHQTPFDLHATFSSFTSSSCHHSPGPSLHSNGG